MPYTKVMHKWGEGSLHSGGKHGPTVPHTKAGQKQAVAIMMSEKRRGTTDAMGYDCWDMLIRGWCKGAKDAGPTDRERIEAQREAFGFATGTGKPSEKSTPRPPTPPKKISKVTGSLLRGWRNEPLSKEYTTKDTKPFHTPSGGVSEAGRERAEAKGQTMRGGRFPIRNLADLAKAKHDVGRAKDPAAVRRWINKRAEELGGRKLGEAKDSGGAGLSAYMQNKGVSQGQATKAVSKQPRLKKWSPPTVREVGR